MDREPTLDDLRWYVTERTEVQRLLLELYTVYKTRTTDIHGIPDLWDGFRLLTGVAFSLWRCVFLLEERFGESVESEARGIDELFKKLLHDNALGYYQEKIANDWVAGYYLNSAYFRLVDAQSAMKERRPLELGTYEAQFWSLKLVDHAVPLNRTRWKPALDAAHGGAHVLRIALNLNISDCCLCTCQ
jgi:hypothetical protein